MERRAVGGSDLRVSVLGLGCWPLGGGDGWGETDVQQGIATIHAALDHGINLFDTAEAYNDGRSEEIVGIALADRRDRALIATKVSPRNTEPSALRAHCEASLRRLRTDYVDLYQIHWPLPSERVEAAIATLEALRAEGKIRSIGVSNHGVCQLDEVVWTGAPVASNQVVYNLLTRAIEFEVVPACRKYGMSVIAYMPLMQGLLADRYGSPDEVPGFRARTRHFASDRAGARHGGPGHEALVFETLGRVRDVCRRLGRPMAEVALGWVMNSRTVASVLVGGRKPEQLLRNLAAAESPLPPDAVAELDAITRPLKDAMGPNIDLWQEGARSRSF